MTEVKTYELTGETKVNEWGVTVKQIRALVDIPRTGVRKGDIGGWIEGDELANGLHRVSGDAWVSGDAQVFGNARVSGDARVERTTDYLVVHPIGSEQVTATLWREKNGKPHLAVGCWNGKIGGLMEEVKRRREHWNADEATKEIWVAQYRALKALGKETVKLWIAENEKKEKKQWL